MNYREALDSLMAHLRLRNYSAATLRVYREQLKRFSEWLPEAALQDLRRLTSADVDQYQQYVQAEPIGPETKALRLRAVKRLFDHLTGTGHLLIHPAEHIVEIRRRQRLPRQVLSVKQVEQLLNAPDPNVPLELRDRALLEVLYSTGIRVGELENVFVSEVNLTEQTLFVRQGKGSKERLVPLGTTAAEWVQRYLNEVRPALVKHRPQERVLFVVKSGEPLKQTQIREILKKYRRRCHLRKPVTPHGLRHACATHLLQAGADIRLIQQLLGHEKLDSTAIYTRVMPSDLKKVHREYHPQEIGNASEDGDGDQ